MTTLPLPVLLVGAAGAFGRRLAEGLADEPGVRLILAGRRRAPLDALRRDLGRAPHVRVLDRNTVTPEDLSALGAAVVIDAAGPFQDGSTALIEAAIDAGCHYIDLADGRDFVANVHRFGAAAQRAGVAVLSGGEREIPAADLEVATLSRGNGRRCFERVPEFELEPLLSDG